MYVDYEYYKALYGSDAVSESEFNRFFWDAFKKIEHYIFWPPFLLKYQSVILSRYHHIWFQNSTSLKSLS